MNRTGWIVLAIVLVLLLVVVAVVLAARRPEPQHWLDPYTDFGKTFGPLLAGLA